VVLRGRGRLLVLLDVEALVLLLDVEALLLFVLESFVFEELESCEPFLLN
jgi:hypothetical protein